MRTRITVVVGVAVASIMACSPSSAQSNRAIALGVAAAGIYGAFGSVECRSGTPAVVDPADGRCKSGWYNHRLQGDPLYDHGVPERDPLQVAGGLVVAGVGTAFAVKPVGRLLESITYAALGGAMVAGAFDFRCRGTRIYGECINTNITSSRFLEDGGQDDLNRVSLLYGGIAVAGLAAVRWIAVDVQASPRGVRISRTFEF